MKSFILTIFLFFFVVNNSSSNPIITGIEDNWNEIKSMSGRFEQIDQEGNFFKGQFFFLKPFKSKFMYDGREEDIITNKSLMVVVDKEGYQIDSFPIGNSILKKLLSEDILIENEFDIISLTDENNFYHLMLRIKDDKSDNQIKFVFDRDSLDLKKWEIYDEFGNKSPGNDYNSDGQLEIAHTDPIYIALFTSWIKT